MKKFAIIALVGLAALLANCGSRTVSQQNLTGAGGNWEATFVGGTGQAALLSFVTNFSVSYGGSSMTINSFSFINTNSCFTSVSGEAGTATLNTNGADQVTGTLTYKIAGAPASSPTTNTSTLTLTANPSVYGQLTGTASSSSGNTALQNGVAYGDWTLTNPNDSTCAGSGTFIMCQEAATCTITNTD